MTSAVTVDKALPDGLLRLATVGCARVTAKGSPVVCASDSDLLPAGAAVAQTAAELDSPAGTASGTYWALGGAGLAAVLAVGGVVLHRRRRALTEVGRP